MSSKEIAKIIMQPRQQTVGDSKRRRDLLAKAGWTTGLARQRSYPPSTSLPFPDVLNSLLRHSTQRSNVLLTSAALAERIEPACSIVTSPHISRSAELSKKPEQVRLCVLECIMGHNP
jgi:hypothetical protein